MTFVELMAKTAHEFGTDSEEFRLAYQGWLLELEQKPSHRPPPDLSIVVNGIVFWLQSAVGSDYRYVPHAIFDKSGFCMELQTTRERILTELRIGRKALTDIRLIEAGILEREEGNAYEEGDDWVDHAKYNKPDYLDLKGIS